jgi:hypothetical protein
VWLGQFLRACCTFWLSKEVTKAWKTTSKKHEVMKGEEESHSLEIVTTEHRHIILNMKKSYLGNIRLSASRHFIKPLLVSDLQNPISCQSASQISMIKTIPPRFLSICLAFNCICRSYTFKFLSTVYNQPPSPWLCSLGIY